jgi:N-acetylmuramoyl-L-alanine amidase
MQDRPVSITLRLVTTGLLLLGVAGCQTPSRPLATVEVQDSLEIAPAAPIEAGSFPPPPAAPVTSVPLVENSRTWPTNWVNAWIPLESWGAFNGLAKPRQIPSNPHPKYEFQTATGPIAVKVGSRIAQCNGLECWLGFAPQIISGQPYIHSVDAIKNLQPILQAAHQTVSSGVIVIDPGHGGQDVGTQNLFNRRYEKDYTLDWALRLKPLLTARGWKVLLTRTSDVDISLADRIALAERAKADLFLSLHFNSGHPNRELSGIETYCLTPSGMPSHLVREYDDDMRQVFPNNAYDEENFMLAFRLHRSLLRYSGAADRGVRRARFMAVLRGQNRPAVLIEAGYLSNQNEAQRISTPEYRQLLAEAVAKALE